MGIDLTLLPLEHDGSFAFAHTMLYCDRQYELFERIREIEKRHGALLGKAFYTYLSRNDDGNLCYGDVQETPYDKPLLTVRTGKLLPAAAGLELYQRNRAAWAYLRELSPDTRIALYWN